MFLTPFFSTQGNQFQFTRRQASHFAKKVASDYNPIHDEDNKRFCVPGDLLFAVLLNRKGVSQKMGFDFSGMVSDGIALSTAEISESESVLLDANGKEYLRMRHEGEVSRDSKFIECLTKAYVKFSGMNFPHIMVPLMKEKQMMINCKRPLVMYQSMEVEFSRVDLSGPTVELAGATFDIEGKRGKVTLNFSFKEKGEIVGKGSKKLVVSGLQPYEKHAVEDLVRQFNARKDAFLNAQTEAA